MAFKPIRIVDNFYQTSAFFPMPTALVGTFAENGQTSLGAYSLLSPYYVAGKDYYAMLLCARNSSNTAQNLLRNPRCTLNFIPDKRKYFREAVRLGFPSQTPQEKMKNCLFTLQEAEEKPGEYPQLVGEAFQVFTCTWMRELDNASQDQPGQREGVPPSEGYPPPYHDFNGITSRHGAHFILRVDKILLKPRQHAALINGVTAAAFPPVPVDYGYRDSIRFWYTPFRRPLAERIPNIKNDLRAVRYAADRADDTVRFTDEACAQLVSVPRIFLPAALKGCVEWAKANQVTLLTAEHMKTIRNKRAGEKGKK